MTSDPPTEVERLRAQVSELESKLADQDADGADGSSASGRTGRWRPVTVTVLLILVGLLAPLSVTAVWVRDELRDTDRYVDTVAPLAQDPAIQDAVADRITRELMTRLDIESITQAAVDALVERGMPPRAAQGLAALSLTLSSGIEDFVHDQATSLVRSDAFAAAWEQANREAHAQLVAVLTGRGTDTVQVSGNTVSVNLATMIEAIKQRLVEAGFTVAGRLPTVNAQFTILESADLVKAQRGFRILDSLAHVLPWLTLLLLGLAVWVARDRRRALLAGALVVVGAMVLLGAALNLARGIYLDSLPSAVSAPAASAVYDALVHFLRISLRSVLVLFLIVGLIAWVTGRGQAPSSVRRGSTTAITAIRTRSGLHTGQFGATLYQLRTAIRVTILAAAFLIYVLAAHPTAGFTLTLAAVVLVLLVVLELLAHPPAAESADISPTA